MRAELVVIVVVQCTLARTMRGTLPVTARKATAPAPI